MDDSQIILILFQFIILLVVVAGFIWRLPTKADITRLDEKIDNRVDDLNTKIDDLRTELKTDIVRLDKKIDDTRTDLLTRIDDVRLELKQDIQRVEDRANEANKYHAQSVELLGAILRQMEERREPL